MRRHISRRRWDGDDWHAEPSTTADLHRWVARGLVRRLSMASTFRGFTIAAIGLMLYLIGFHSMAIPYLQRMESTAGEVAIAASRRTHPRVAGRGWQGRDVYDSTAAAERHPCSEAGCALCKLKHESCVMRRPYPAPALLIAGSIIGALFVLYSHPCSCL